MTYRTLTMTLKGAERPFVRSLTFRHDITGDELLDRLCLALGRYPTPDALFRVGETYHARRAYHFDHPDLSDEWITGPLPEDVHELEFLLHRTDGWIFRLDIVEDHSPFWDNEQPPILLNDTTPLLPGPKLRLAEFNALTLAHDERPLPPDLERMIIVDALEGLLVPEVADVEAAMALYTVLREEGRQAEMAGHHRFLSGLPDRDILFELLRRATSAKPPRVTKSGYLPVGVVRDLVDKYPALYPLPQRRSRYYGYGPSVGTAREVTTLTSVLDVGAKAGLLIVEPGESLRATDIGHQLLTGDGDTYTELQSRLLRAWIDRPVAQAPTDPGGRRLTFQEYLNRQRPTDREIDEDTYHRVQAQRRHRQPSPYPAEVDVPF
ncbi:MAG: hypothetical protein Q4G50_06280 [Corynebacterium sp.]|uniref:hypothetical protein n=1 Tax=Corynebacterium sp. TaxID=1720 RepID=UPI0026E0378B|nr:hypothetical protein [Corynebacterium sp.]MDO5669593.1 hypothetical protein [Corynebacterium sp.]